jgi:hypothetical protein
MVQSTQFLYMATCDAPRTLRALLLLFLFFLLCTVIPDVKPRQWYLPSVTRRIGSQTSKCTRIISCTPNRGPNSTEVNLVNSSKPKPCDVLLNLFAKLCTNCQKVERNKSKSVCVCTSLRTNTCCARISSCRGEGVGLPGKGVGLPREGFLLGLTSSHEVSVSS